jgi:hypothetical protein
VHYVEPAPDVFEIPAECPDPIADEIRKSFSLFWIDIAAAANRIRASVELLMTDFGIGLKERRGGKYHSMTLHRRIERYSLDNPDLGAALLAVKWLGNTGSHASKLTRDDLFDAYEILEHVLAEEYAKRTERIRRMTRAINRRKGPRRRKS